MIAARRWKYPLWSLSFKQSLRLADGLDGNVAVLATFNADYSLQFTSELTCLPISREKELTAMAAPGVWAAIDSAATLLRRAKEKLFARPCNEDLQILQSARFYSSQAKPTFECMKCKPC